MGKRYEEMTFDELLAQMDGWVRYVLSMAKYDNSITSDGAEIFQQLRGFIKEIPQLRG